MIKFAFSFLLTFFTFPSTNLNMAGISRKCPFCKEDAILRMIEPDFRKGVFRRVFVCKNGYKFKEENSFDEERKWVKEVFEELSKDWNGKIAR